MKINLIMIPSTTAKRIADDVNNKEHINYDYTCSDDSDSEELYVQYQDIYTDSNKQKLYVQLIECLDSEFQQYITDLAHKGEYSLCIMFDIEDLGDEIDFFAIFPNYANDGEGCNCCDWYWGRESCPCCGYIYNNYRNDDVGGFIGSIENYYKNFGYNCDIYLDEILKNNSLIIKLSWDEKN